jgi:bifunctional UDP-N-acetylglucosamine pyrophosphorylase/glucosamine-1-phosphate N-acetyltransferase
MRSSVPKVLHAAAGRPLVYYPIFVAKELGVQRVVVVASPLTEAPIREVLGQAFAGLDIVTVVQSPPRGTGDAARIGLEAVSTSQVVILCGDTPLLRKVDVGNLVNALHQDESLPLAFLSCVVDEPSGYGRVLRNSAGNVVEIREHRDLKTARERAVNEVNAGVYAGKTASLRDALNRLSPDNAQGEYYLTDVVADLGREQNVLALRGDESALLGVNDRSQLTQAEKLLWERKAVALGQSGVTIRGEVYVDDSVVVEPDVVLESGVRLRGATTIHSGASIDVGSVVTDSVVQAGARLLPYSIVTESDVGEAAQIGPFSHMRPGSVLEAEAKLGNFVETKQARLRRGAKANHLSYLGDIDVGERVNIGAGTIVCNYDGFKKHKTVIGEGTFIGSDSQLIAPVNIGKNAYVATATSVTEDVPDEALAIGRQRQTNKLGYATMLRRRLAEAAKK